MRPTPLPALLICAALAGCFPTADEVRRGPPAMRADFPAGSEAVTACIARHWGALRLADGTALRVRTRTVAGTGTVAVMPQQVDAIAWFVEVNRRGEQASATAWARRVASIPPEASFAQAMRRVVEACAGEVTEDRYERPLPRRIA